MGNAPTALNPQHNNISALYFCYHEGKRMNGSLKKDAATISHDGCFSKKQKPLEIGFHGDVFCLKIYLMEQFQPPLCIVTC